MKNNILLLAGIALFAFTGCEKETTGGLSKVTNYPLMEVAGPTTVYLEAGTAYTDPGVTATENGQDIPVVTTSGLGTYRGESFDVNVPDKYTLTYTSTNQDGFDGVKARTLWVYKTGDLVNSIEGLYNATVVRNGSSGAPYTSMKHVLIWKNADGTYELSCGIGSYYETGRRYGINYIAPGAVITANSIAGNDFVLPTFSVRSFGGVCEMTSMSVDAANKTISFSTDWDAGYTFEVELKQVQP
jgi:hypothetical protein